MTFDSAAARNGEEDFASLFAESIGSAPFTGAVVTGTVVKLGDGFALVDVGLKSEGRVDLREFSDGNGKADISVGDKVDLFVERYEDKDGTVVLSRDRAKREEAWVVLERSFADKEHVTGQMCGRVKGGYTVELGGAQAFLPNSQVDIRPIRDAGPLMYTPQPFVIIKMDRPRGNIVVSRRAVLEEARAGQRGELIKNLKEGAIFEAGIVKNLTDYGAFVDLGGVDGLLHVTDIAWRRVGHPNEVLTVGQSVRVQVIRFSQETGRISLGMKQLTADPWEGVAAKYPQGAKFSGRVTNVTEYGAFVELEPGIEGLVHSTEMSWGKPAVHPGKLVATSQQVDVVVLDVDEAKRRVSLGMKQAMANPWQDFADANPIGSIIEGEVKSVTEFGVFVQVAPDLDGMVHLGDLSWDETPAEMPAIAAGTRMRVKVIDVDVERERIGLGVKQLESDPLGDALESVKKDEIVTCVVMKIEANGIEVGIGDVLTGFIRRAELGRDRSDQRPDRFSVGERVDARVTAVDRIGRRVTLTIKGKEVDEDRQAVEKFGAAESGASLGDILSAAMRRRNTAQE